jgi:hypothetical protein
MPRLTNPHEAFDDGVKPGSERSFGLVFAAVLSIVAAWPLIDGAEPRLWALAVAAGFLGSAMIAPGLLRPFNLLWFKFGQVLHRVTSPLIMGLLFFTTVTPMALLMRLFGRDPLNRRFDAAAESYWIIREPPGPAPESLRKQF